MARQQRVFGPYPHRQKWRLQLVDEGGRAHYFSYETEDQARAVKKDLERKLEAQPPKTIGQALEEYELYLRDEKQNKPRSIVTTLFRLRGFFPQQELPIRDLSEKRCSDYYEALTKRVIPGKGDKPAVDTHRNMLAEAKTFLRWCHQSKKWLTSNPLEGVNGKGRRNSGKEQLRIDEARHWLTKATELAVDGEDGAIAALVTLMMGLRCSEVVSRTVRDLDDQGKLLWIPSSKTAAGRRTLEVPKTLQQLLLDLAKGKPPTALLFGARDRAWPRKWVQRVCRLARVPVVTAHGMRGLHATLALQAGTSGHIVAASLGHESISTTLRSYADRNVVAGADQRRALNKLTGEEREE